MPSLLAFVTLQLNGVSMWLISFFAGIGVELAEFVHLEAMKRRVPQLRDPSIRPKFGHDPVGRRVQ